MQKIENYISILNKYQRIYAINSKKLDIIMVALIKEFTN